VNGLELFASPINKIPVGPYDCGINRTYLSAVERAERNVSIDNIARIAKALQVEPWKLLRDD
jgi:Helix-turn-helix